MFCEDPHLHILDLDKQSEGAEQGCEKWGNEVSRQSQRSESSSVVVVFFLRL